MIALWDDDSLPGMPDPEPAVHLRLTERDMLDLLHKRYSQSSYNGGVKAPRYICAEQVRSSAGFSARRTADFIAVETWESSLRNGLTVHGAEVKVSRSDWLRELADPDKAAVSMAYVSHCWLAAADASVVRPGEGVAVNDDLLWGYRPATGGIPAGQRCALGRDSNPQPSDP